jgi:thiol-disulfide isomerase/thioredoxin
MKSINKYKKILLLSAILFVLLFTFSSSLVFAQEQEIIPASIMYNNSIQTTHNSSDLAVDFFWMSGCSACKLMTPWLNELQSEYGFELRSFEVSRNSKLFSLTLEEHNVPDDKRGYVPVVFINGEYFVGFSDDVQKSILAILNGEEIVQNTSQVKDTVSTKVLGFWDVNLSLDNRSILGAGILLALLDSINVCSLTVLIFLIVFSLSIGSPKRAFRTGLIFTGVIFLFYMLFMLVLTSVLGTFIIQYGSLIRLLVFIISLTAGLLLIKDVFWYGKGISLAVPKSAKPLLEKFIKRATIGSTIILGLLASLVELPCTAVFPLVFTTLLAQSQIFGFSAFVYILLYNLIYIWPLVFLVLATYFSWTKIENVDATIQKNKKWLRLIAGLALVGIALYFGWPILF